MTWEVQRDCFSAVDFTAHGTPVTTVAGNLWFVVQSELRLNRNTNTVSMFTVGAWDQPLPWHALTEDYLYWPSSLSMLVGEWVSFLSILSLLLQTGPTATPQDGFHVLCNLQPHSLRAELSWVLWYGPTSGEILLFLCKLWLKGLQVLACKEPYLKFTVQKVLEVLETNNYSSSWSYRRC